jgi:mono/diheme cytochrome c family protein
MIEPTIMRTLITTAILCGAFGLALTTTTATHADETQAKVQALWKEHCTQCHGDDGRGRTPMGRKLRVQDYTDPKVQAKYTDEEMIKITKEGVKQGNRVLMKPYKDELTEEEIKQLVAYIRKFSKKE